MTTTITQIHDTTTGQDGTNLNRWNILADGTTIAELLVDSTTDVIYHDTPWHRSSDGDRWATSVGGPTIETCDCRGHLFEEDEYDEEC